MKVLNSSGSHKLIPNSKLPTLRKVVMVKISVESIVITTVNQPAHDSHAPACYISPSPVL